MADCVSQDQAAGSCKDASITVSSQPQSVAAQLKVFCSSGDGVLLKVRKPYTITKQRERWTEEEHLKFVEALKLYGRAWRQIEEHVGTKTAIQIRSHAQKFFAKVTRDSTADAEGSLNPIEIPPPRPKKKPLHPYPRKVVDSANIEINISNHLEKTCPLDESVAERENLSPTSVLSTTGSDVLETTVTDIPKSHASPTSCATDAHSANLTFPENENENVTSNLSELQEGGSNMLMMKSSEAVPDSKSNMIQKFELFPSQETESFMISPSLEEAHTSIKLFGKTVVVTDIPKQSIEVTEVYESPPNYVVKSEMDDKLVQGSESSNSHSQVVFGIVPNSAGLSCLPQPSLNPAACYSFGNMFTLPWFTWYQGVAYPYTSSWTETGTAPDSNGEGLKNEELERERSLVGSNSGSGSEGNTLNQNSDVIESKNQSNSGKKGFVPYKRCLTERDDNSSVSFLQEREGQRARVCS